MLPHIHVYLVPIKASSTLTEMASDYQEFRVKWLSYIEKYSEGFEI